MDNLHIIAFALFTFTIISFWVKQSPKIWIPLFAGSIIIGFFGDLVNMWGILITIALGFFWYAYIKQSHPSIKGLFFLIILLVSFGLKFHIIPGFPPIDVANAFKIGFESPLIGFFPLALIIPFATTSESWKKIWLGVLWGCLGIFVIFFCAIASDAISWNPRLPTAPWTRYWSLLFLTVIPEEAFFRGFLQHRLCVYLQNTPWGKTIGVVATAVLFALSHIFWAPSMSILALVFVSGLVYGGVYAKTGKIEAAILTHFLLNFLHISFF